MCSVGTPCLADLLACRSEWQQGRDTVVLVGDLVGKGLQSAQVRPRSVL